MAGCSHQAAQTQHGQTLFFVMWCHAHQLATPWPVLPRRWRQHFGVYERHVAEGLVLNLDTMLGNSRAGALMQLDLHSHDHTFVTSSRFYFQDCDALLSGRWVSTFQRIMPPPLGHCYSEAPATTCVVTHSSLYISIAIKLSNPFSNQQDIFLCHPSSSVYWTAMCTFYANSKVLVE